MAEPDAYSRRAAEYAELFGAVDKGMEVEGLDLVPRSLNTPEGDSLNVPHAVTTDPGRRPHAALVARRT
ncbi:hypothetical protein [Sinomonas halotolerans]|uniref:Uncharacterized protein n=1 Tax=Sinomonas halotolerans TaxID=1644133 RepID=A0ABU9X0X3_9MICC